MNNVFIALILALSVFLAAPGDMEAQSTHSHMGVHADQGNLTKTQDNIAHMDSTGAEWIRYTFYWSELEPSDDSWAFDSVGVDDDITEYLSSGKKVLAVFAQAPEWAYSMAGETVCDDTYNGEVKFGRCAPDAQVEYAEFEEFVAKVESEYPGIDHYEAWNETFHDSDDYATTTEGVFFEHSPDVEDEVIKATHAALDTFPGTNYILCCGYMPDTLSGNVVGEKLDSVGTYIDIITLHKYTSGAAASDIKNWVNEVKSETGTSKEIWVTEFGMGGSTDDHIDDQAEILDVVFSDTQADLQWGVSFEFRFSRDSTNQFLVWDYNDSSFDPIAGAYCRMVAEAGNLSLVGFCVSDLTINRTTLTPNQTCTLDVSENAGSTPSRWGWSVSAGTIQSTDGNEAEITTPGSDFTITVEVDEYFTEVFEITVTSQTIDCITRLSTRTRPPPYR